MILRALVIAATVVLVVPSSGQGAEWRYGIEYRPGYSSNIARTADNELEEYTNTLRVDMDYREQSTALEGSVAAHVEYLDYRSDIFQDETRGVLDANLRWALLRDRIFWTVEDRLSVEPVLIRQPRTPSNIQQTNLLSVGPSLAYRLGDNTTMSAELRFINSYAEITTEYNSNRWQLAASVTQRRSIVSDLSANLLLGTVDFRNEYARDYRKGQLFLAWDRRFGRSGFRLELGGVAIDFDDARDRTGPYFQLEWNRVISSVSRMRLGLGHGLSDAAQQAARGTSATRLVSNTISSEVYENSELDLLHRYQWARSVLETGINYQKQRFLNSPDMDQRLFNVRISWSRGYGAGVSTEVGISLARTEYELDRRQDDTIAPFFGIHLQRSSRLHYGLRVEREVRDSSEDPSDYDDLTIFATIGYRS